MPTDCKLTGVIGASIRNFTFWAEVRSPRNETICYELFDSEYQATHWLQSLGIDEIRCEFRA